MMERCSIITSRAHFSQRTREMGHPDYLWVGEVGDPPKRRLNKQPGPLLACERID